MVPLEPVGEALGATVRRDAADGSMDLSTAAPAKTVPATVPVAAKSAATVKPPAKTAAPAKPAATVKPAATAAKAAPKPFLQEYQDPKASRDDLPMGKVVLDLFLKLLVVLGIAWVAIFILSKFKGTGAPLAGRRGYLKVLESVTLGTNRSIHLVRVGEKVMVIGATPEQVNTLGEIDAPALLDELVGERSSSAFGAHLNAAMVREEVIDGLAGDVRGGASHILDRAREIQGLGGKARPK
jgi:flagellar biosynthetic protein FliO